MAQQNIDFGSFPDDPSADAIRTAFNKVQNNFDQLFGTNADSTVNSINRTPGAGITVNYPTGNVVISANIACLLVSTTSLKVGRCADNTQSNVTITSSSQQLNIDIDPAQVLSNTFASPGMGLANLNGTLTSNSFYQPNINTLGTLANLIVSGNANFSGITNFTNNVNFTGANISLGSNANLRITGGTIGQYLQTDGAGNLSWAAGGGGGNGSPGGVNTSVQFNDVGGFGANTGFTFDKTTGVLSTPSLNVANTAIIGNLQGSLANGNSNINIPVANGNVNISAAGNANVFVVTGIGVNVASNLNVEDKISANRIEVNLITGTLTTNAQPNVTSVGTLTSLDVTGNITAGNVYANSGTIGASLLTGTLTTNAQPNVTSVGTLTSLSVTGNANVGNLNVANNVIVTGNLSVLGNATYINIESLVVEDPIISLGGGPNGDPLTTNDGKDRGTALQYYTTLPVTAFMGWDNSEGEFAFGSNVAIVSEVVTFTNYGNARASFFKGDNTQFGNANLGNTATANYFVGNFYGTANSATTAGTVTTAAQPNITSVGVLTSLSVSGNATVGNLIGRVANGNSGITIAADSNINLTAVGNATAQLIITSTGANVNGTLGVSGNANIGNIGTAGLVTATGNVIAGNLVTGGQVSVTGNITSASGVFVGNGAGLTNINAGNITGAYGNSQVATFLNAFGSNTITTTGNVSVGNIIGNGQALTGLAGGNVAGQVGNALVAGTVYTAAQPNITSTGTLTSLAVTGNISAGNVSATTFTGALSGAATSATTAATVTTNAQPNITSTGTLTSLAVTGNISAGNVSATTFTGALSGAATTAGTVTTNAQPNITSVGTLSSLSVSGNITAGNISATNHTGTTANITGQYITTLATGTAPFVVTSTTQVANLSVATAGLATFATTANAVAGANVSGTVANATFATSAGSAGSATSAVSATTAGTVTTNAQPNITSVGTLSSLAVTGNLSTGNISASGNISAGNFVGTGAGSPTISSSGTLSISATSGVTINNVVTLSTGANTTAGTLTGNWTLSTGSRMQATYADLAEYYAGSEKIEPGTVVEFGGEHEVQICNSYMSTLVAGIVTTYPAYVMNSGIDCTYPVAIALQGRIPVKVVGPVKRGDMLVSTNNGHAISCQTPSMGTVLGKALVDFNGEYGTIEVMVGRT